MRAALFAYVFPMPGLHTWESASGCMGASAHRLAEIIRVGTSTTFASRWLGCGRETGKGKTGCTVESALPGHICRICWNNWALEKT